MNKALGGRGRVYRGSDIQSHEYQRRSSGIPSIDYITSGGYPRGGLVEIGGEFSVGKTSVALEACATEQRAVLDAFRNGTNPASNGGIAWVALEPFSKKFARERGLFIPFSEELAADPETGELKPLDSVDNASELEKFRMEQAGIMDPHAEYTPFVLVQEERGDAALDAAITLLRSNLFSILVVDSLGVAKSTKWLEETEVQDSGDFPREAKMIGDYTARALLTLNARYDANNQISKDGTYTNQTTVLHLNHIGINIGTQARAVHKTQRIKGGEGNKHNHHFIMFLSKGEQYRVEGPGGKPYVYAQEIRCLGLKSKLGPDYLEGAFDYYKLDYGGFRQGDFDVVKDLVTLAQIAGLVGRNGAWYNYMDIRTSGLDNFGAALRERPDLVTTLREETRLALRR